MAANSTFASAARIANILVLDSHNGQSHDDDVASFATFLAEIEAARLELGMTTLPPVKVVRRDPTEADFADPNIIVLDVGKRPVDFEFGNLDHHGNAALPCAFVLTEEFFGIKEEMQAAYPSVLVTDMMDLKGPFMTSKALNVKPEVFFGRLSLLSLVFKAQIDRVDGEMPQTVADELCLIGKALLAGVKRCTEDPEAFRASQLSKANLENKLIGLALLLAKTGSSNLELRDSEFVLDGTPTCDALQAAESLGLKDEMLGAFPALKLMDKIGQLGLEKVAEESGVTPQLLMDIKGILGDGLEALFDEVEGQVPTILVELFRKIGQQLISQAEAYRKDLAVLLALPTFEVKGLRCVRLPDELRLTPALQAFLDQGKINVFFHQERANAGHEQFMRVADHAWVDFRRLKKEQTSVSFTYDGEEIPLLFVHPSGFCGAIRCVLPAFGPEDGEEVRKKAIATAQAQAIKALEAATVVPSAS